MAIEDIQVSSQSRRSIYTVWLRFAAFISVLAGTIILVSPSFLFSYSDPDLPWNEQFRILPSGRTPTCEPSPDQPKIIHALHYKTHALQDDSTRGTLNFIISPEGVVKGIWNGEYDEEDGSHCILVAASFIGNIDPTKPCIKENIHDASKLYFISSGSFYLLKTAVSSGHNRGINGFIYVRGWLDLNYGATGELFITENKKTFDAFSWSAEPTD
ncbi:MAG: hypothetical protein JW749_04910 [Sedimentisphaerales bacterium]|nr:hypothetical protein [Sedimentisphaerales bacterium]